VDELEKILRRKKNKPEQRVSWVSLEELIVQKYSWGMPKGIREYFKR
jgi:hypothetical protein